MRSTHRPTGTGAGARRGDGSLRMRDGATASGRPRHRSSQGKRVRSGGGLATDAACALPCAARRSSGEGARAGKAEFRRERVSRGRPGGPEPISGGSGTCPVVRAGRRGGAGVGDTGRMAGRPPPRRFLFRSPGRTAHRGAASHDRTTPSPTFAPARPRRQTPPREVRQDVRCQRDYRPSVFAPAPAGIARPSCAAPYEAASSPAPSATPTKRPPPRHGERPAGERALRTRPSSRVFG